MNFPRLRLPWKPGREGPGQASTTSAALPARGIYYGWYIVAVGFLVNFAYSEQFSASYGVFIYHIEASTGWGRTILAGAKTLSRLVEGVLAPFVGPIVDRYGARWLMVGGGVLYGLSFMAVATVDQLWQLFLFYGVLMAVGSVAFGGFVVTVTVANWFVLKRARAIAFASMGMSVGTTLLPLLASALIDAWGWRVAWFVLGLFILVVTVPAALFIRRRPEDLGLQPDGIDSNTPATSDREVADQRRREALMAADVVWTRRDVIRSPLVWVLVLAFGFAQFAHASTTLHMVPFFLDLGYPLLLAAGALSLRSGITLVGNPVWGYILDRVPLKPTVSLQFLLVALGLGAWLLPPSTPTLLGGLILFGVGAAGSQIASEILWATFYGRQSLGTVRGIAYPLQTFFAAIGPFVVGLLYDLSGSYQSSFAIMVVGCLASAVVIQFVQPPKRRGAPVL